jgi:FtsZ-binding cell division protein ZapB
MSLLSKLGLVYDDSESEQPIEEEVKKESVKSVDVPEKTPTPKSEPLSFRESDYSPTSLSGSFDQAVFDKLSKAIEDNNLKGNDFLEFLKALNGLSSMQMDDNTKFNMVFATFASSSEGITKEQLLSSITHYLEVLASERAIFSKETQTVIKDKVEKSIQELNNNEKLIKSKIDEIEKLKLEIETIKQNNQKLSLEINEIKAKIEIKKVNFEYTYNSLINQISSYKGKIETYIK